MKAASRQLLACRRANGQDDALPLLKKAEREVERDALASAGYARQREFDRAVSSVLDDVQMPADDREKITSAWRETLAHRPVGKNLLLHPAFLCGIVAIIAICVVLALTPRSQFQRFRGDDIISRLMDVAAHTRSSEMEVADGPVGELGDLLFMKGIEHFTAPPQFADFRVERLQVENFEQQPVAQIACGDRLTFFVFEDDAFDIELDPDGKWYLVEENDRAAVVRKIDRVVFVATRPGSAAKLAKKVELADRSTK